ncbi:MAG: tRNA (adenosine(37)-N6)-threonylcarbamoyltransferase complex ATPase subunit type 1 TsaE [Pseudomonadota bacterium]|nr:tRNA (adenosine(37)-N6)-threonylcarbamoyltransferase complex ATPase subunit type 1 TsaE [Pseudomonadota bacterium]
MTRVPIAETHAVDPPATQRVASALAPHLAIGDVVALRGDLGAGKSVFARAVIHSCGLAGVDVPSPTFTLVQTYAGRRAGQALDIAHLDCFRLEDPEEALELGLDELMADHLCLIEWPDRIAPYLPADRLDVTIEIAADGGRFIALAGGGRWSDRLAAADLSGATP